VIYAFTVVPQQLSGGVQQAARLESTTEEVQGNASRGHGAISLHHQHKRAYKEPFLSAAVTKLFNTERGLL